MKTTKLLPMLVLALGTTLADAATTVNYGPSTTCTTYCTGFVTDNAAYVLNWLNAVYALTTQPRTLLAVNSLSYSGSTTATMVSTIGTHRFYQVNGQLLAANGATLAVSYMLEYWTTTIVSGRGVNQVVVHRAVNGGDLVLP